MKEYIEREAAIKAAQDGVDEWDGGFARGRDVYIETAIDKVPNADVEKVRHAKWIFDGECGITKCSACKWTIEECFFNPNTGKPYKRCPECGAKMDKKIKTNLMRF